MLDPNFFIYWEETEWCIRAMRGGWQIFNVPRARVWHKGVQRDYQPVPFLVNSFGSELNQVWTNIIDNAIDAMGGKGEIRIRTFVEGPNPPSPFP